MESTIAARKPTRADFLAKQKQHSADFTRLDTPGETASQKFLRRFDTVEAFLSCLPHEDLIPCLDISRTFRLVSRLSQRVQHCIFGYLPPNHNLVWKVKPSDRGPGGSWRQIEVVHDTLYRHPKWTKACYHRGFRYVTIPVVFNSQIFESWRLSTWFGDRRVQEEGIGDRPSLPPLTVSQALWDRVESDHAGPHNEKYTVLMPLNLDERLSEIPLTEPAVTDITIQLEKLEDGVRIQRKSFRVTRPGGVHVKDLVAEATKAGPEWVELLQGGAEVYIHDDMVTVVTREVYDMVQNAGVIHEGS